MFETCIRVLNFPRQSTFPDEPTLSFQYQVQLWQLGEERIVTGNTIPRIILHRAPPCRENQKKKCWRIK